MCTVDSHAHVFIQGLPLAENCRYVPDYNASAEDYLMQLDTAAIDMGILIQPSFLGSDNHFMLDALRRYPQRLRGVAVVDTAITLTELEQMDKLGIIGIRLNLIGLTLPDFDTPQWILLLDHLKQLGWHIELHRAAADLPALITPLLSSGVKIVIDHFGLPDIALLENDPGFQFLLNSAASGQVWVKLSGGYRNGGDANVSRLIPPLLKHFASERLLWGSDWPHTRYEDQVNYASTQAALNHWITDAKLRNQIMTKGPAALMSKQRL